MEREAEPELMDDAEQAAAYARADFEGPHACFIQLFREFKERQGSIHFSPPF